MERILTVTNSPKVTKHKKTALYVLLIYILMHISSRWLLLPFHKLVMKMTGLASEQAAPHNCLGYSWFLPCIFWSNDWSSY